MNPIFYHSGGGIYDSQFAPGEPEGWYFWTETWADYVGPYSTKEQAEQMLREYVLSL